MHDIGNAVGQHRLLYAYPALYRNSQMNGHNRQLPRTLDFTKVSLPDCPEKINNLIQRKQPIKAYLID